MYISKFKKHKTRNKIIKYLYNTWICVFATLIVLIVLMPLWVSIHHSFPIVFGEIKTIFINFFNGDTNDKI